MDARKDPGEADEKPSSPWSAATILHATPVGPALVVARRRRRRAAAEQAWRYRIFGEVAADSARVHMVVREEDLLHTEEVMAEAACRAADFFDEAGSAGSAALSTAG
jgi:hypothetical protein